MDENVGLTRKDVLIINLKSNQIFLGAGVAACAGLVKIFLQPFYTCLSYILERSSPVEWMD